METTGNKNKVIGFCRVSTDRQENSMEVQTERISKYCELNNLELVDVIVDFGVSAYKKDFYKRAGGLKLRTYLDGNNINGVVAVKLDRLFRGCADALTVTKEWDKLDIALHLIDMGGTSINTKTPMGRMMFTMMAGFAELESAQISERVKTVASHRKKNMSSYAVTPFGFKQVVDEAAGPQRNKSGKKIDLVPVGDELEIVKSMFAMSRNGVSKPQIANEFNRTNLRNGVKKRWYPSTVTYVLKNDIYKNYL